MTASLDSAVAACPPLFLLDDDDSNDDDDEQGHQAVYLARPPTMLETQPGVTLHPVNHRSSSFKQQQQRPFKPSRPTLSTRPSNLHPRPSLSRTTSRPTVTRPHGLILDHAQFPLLDSTSSYPVRTLSADQFAKVQRAYSEMVVPEEVLFPWLHSGADVPYSSASQYFGFTHGEAAQVPR